MSRNGTGTYSLPAGVNPVVPNTTIDVGWANTTMNDVAAALTQSVASDGQTPMTGALKLTDGTVGAPALTFNSEATTGIFRPTTNVLAFSAGGIEQARLVGGNLLLGSTSSSGEKLQVTGTSKFAGAVSITGAATLTVTGGTALSGTLNVIGDSALNYLSAASVDVQSLSASTNIFAGGTITCAGSFVGNITGNSGTTTQRTFSNVKTDGVTFGSYGSFGASGSTGGYSGISFAAASATLMLANDQTHFGFYKNNNTWVWGVDSSGTLSEGSVPWSKLTGVGAAAPSFTTVAASTGAGAARLSSGNSTNTGYIEFIENAGTRQGYIGYSTTHAGQDAGTIPFVMAQAGFTGSAVANGYICAGYGFGTPSTTSGDLNTIRSGGTTGVLWFGNLSQTRYLYYDGTKYNLAGASLLVDGDITAFSDRRVKADVEVIHDALAKVKKLRGVTYRRTDVEDTQKRHAGLIAQDVEKVLPEAVGETTKTSPDGKKSRRKLKTLAYDQVIALLVESIKELTEKVEKLEAA